MAVTYKNKLNINNKKGTFRNMKHKKRSYQKRKTLKKRKNMKGGGDKSKSKSKKAYKSSNEPKPSKKTIKIKALTEKLPEKPPNSLGRAFSGYSLEDVEKMNKTQLGKIYDDWRLKEAIERNSLRLKDIIKKTPIYNTRPSDEFSDIHYDGEPFDMYNPPNKIKQSFEVTQHWLDEVLSKSPKSRKSRKSPKSRKQNNWIPLNIQSQNNEYDINNPPSQMKREFEQFSDEFDENNTYMREPEYNLIETDEDLELLDIDDEEK
jgi:hypothetical protein